MASFNLWTMRVIAFRGTLILGTRLPALTNSKRQVKAEKVEAVADVSDAGLFHRQFARRNVAVEQLSNSITQSLCVSLGTPRDEYAPVVRVTCESNIGAS